MSTIKKKEYKFLDGSSFEVIGEICRGCYLEKNVEVLPEIFRPVVSNRRFAIRQDAEFPVPGFYILSLRDHVNSLADVDEETAEQIGVCTFILRKAMRELFSIERAHIYIEEKSNDPHYHTWLLPIWSDIKIKHNIEPRIWESNIKQYLELFDYEDEREKIKDFNSRLRNYLLAHPYFQLLKFR